MNKREMITCLLLDEIQNKQSSDTYTFNSGTIFWVASQEYFGLQQSNNIEYADPGDLGDLIDMLTDEDLQDWFDEEFEDYEPSDILALVEEAAE